MAIYTNSKNRTGSAWPQRATDTDNFLRYEPLLTPDQLRSRFLFGVNLQSQYVNPVTKKNDIVTNDMLTDFIIRAANQAELELKTEIFPVARSERHAFDRPAFKQYGYFRTLHKPIASVERVAIELPNQSQIFELDLSWIENGGFLKGRINVVPFNVAAVDDSAVGIAETSTNSGLLFLSIVNGAPWIPALITIEYTTGFPNGSIPVILNELIGTIACTDILNMMQSTYSVNSYSLSLDGISQSVSGPGPNVFKPRLDALAAQKKRLVDQMRAILGTRFGLSNI